MVIDSWPAGCLLSDEFANWCPKPLDTIGAVVVYFSCRAGHPPRGRTEMTTITCERHPDQISDATPLRVTIKGVAYNAPSSTLYGVKVTTRYFRAAHRSGSDRIGFTLSVNGGPQDAPRFGFFSVPDAYRAAKLEIQEIFRSQLPACKRCGGAGGWVGWPGFTCYECGGSGVELPKDG